MPQTSVAAATRVARTPWYRVLYIQVLIAIAIGIVLGHFWPDVAKQMEPLGDAFIALIKMMIAPIIFCTVVHGISSMGDLRRVGRVGIKTLVYFESFPTAADAIQREARLKKYPRAWKINLILANNPGWRDLAEGLNG